MMYAVNQTTLKNCEIGILDPSTYNASISNPTHARLNRKVNLRRGKNKTNKIRLVDSSEIDPRFNSTSVLNARRQERRKLRNAKELENCRTSRSHSDDRSDKTYEKSPISRRSCSMSPTPTTPPLVANMPMRKFFSCYSKIIEQLEIVRIFVNRQPGVAESLQELNRQRKRATEFAVRFSRNNIYQMKRLVNEVKQIIVPYPFDNLAKRDSDVLCKKILLAYQTASQALQTYIKYMKSGSNLDVPEKTRELLLLIVDLYLCCEHLSLPGEQIDILTPCRDLIVCLDVKIAEADCKTQLLKVNDKIKDADKEDKRFSMYKAKLNNLAWKKKTESLAKVKFGSPKLSYLKKLKKREEHCTVPKSTIEIYSQIANQDPSTKKAAEDCAKGVKQAPLTLQPVKKHHFTPREVTSQDDDIETVVQSIDEEDTGITHRVPDAGLTPGYHTETEQGYINKRDIRDMVLQALEELQTSEKSGVQYSLKKLLKSLNYAGNEKERVPPRNVKLVHIISHETIPEEPAEIPEAVEEVATEPEEIKEDVAEVKKRKFIFETLSAKGGLFSGNRKTMKVPEGTFQALMKYKKMLGEYRRNNVLYKKGIPIRPCELVVRISEQIIIDILREISSGMENENLLQHLYYSELMEAL